VLAIRSFPFADLRAYSRFVEQDGDLAAASLIADCRRIVRADSRHESSEVKIEGDSFSVVFNANGSARALIECRRRAKTTAYVQRLEAVAGDLSVPTAPR
jgi:class 3 adenylate cyclase